MQIVTDGQIAAIGLLNRLIASRTLVINYKLTLAYRKVYANTVLDVTVLFVHGYRLKNNIDFRQVGLKASM